jgi:hypothetical protein
MTEAKTHNHERSQALVLDALEQALWARRRHGWGSLAGLVHHTDAGSQAAVISIQLPTTAISPAGDQARRTQDEW